MNASNSVFALLFVVSASTPVLSEPILSDDFESGLAGWELSSESKIRIVESGDASHGGVLELSPSAAPVYVLARDIGTSPGVRMEGEFRFPVEGDSYFGVVYNFRRAGERTDFGCIYVKGNGSYIRVNSHLDGNPARALYEEFRVPLTDAVAVKDGVWYPFRVEVMGRMCHLYVNDLEEPRITFELFDGDSGAIGFEARPFRGAPVWIDDVSISNIDAFSYTGTPIPERPAYETKNLLTSWEVLGPFAEPQVKLERDLKKIGADDWRPLPADPRGAVLTGTVTEFRGKSKIAYARTTLTNSGGRRVDAVLEVATVDKLQVWLNGEFVQEVKPLRLAWYDFLSNPEHAGVSVPIRLKPGDNDLVVRIDGGKFAGGGFFAGMKISR